MESQTEKYLLSSAFCVPSTISGASVDDEWYVNAVRLKSELRFRDTHRGTCSVVVLTTGTRAVNICKTEEDSVKALSEWSALPVSRTKLGMRLREIRERIVKSGVPLLSMEEIQQEISKQRGEL